MNTRPVSLLLVLALCCANCSCPNVPPVPVPGDRANAHQVRCHCSFDFDLLAEGAGARDQQFDIDLCLPNRLNVNLATGDDAVALSAMSDAEYAQAVSGYCSNDVHDLLIAVAGRANSNICGQLEHVAVVCSLGLAGPGQSVVFNPMCELPCADVPCRAPACDPSMLIDGQNMLHPEKCKCTEGLGCGIHTEVVCTTPNWMTDPPTIASGLTTYLLSAPHAARVDSAHSSATVTVSVDTGPTCGTLSDTATAPISGTITLFGPPCPSGEACDRLMDFTLALGDISLAYTCGAVTQGAAITKASLVGGSEGRPVHIDANGNIVVPTNTLRLGGSFVRDGQQQYAIDTHNSEPIMLRVDYAAGTISIHDGISFVDGALDLNLVAQMVNRPPVAHAGDDRTIECQTNGAVVTLDATASSDPESNIQRFQWWAHGHALEEGALVGLGATPTLTVPLGSTTLDLGVTDDALLTSIDTIALTVVDTTAPQLSLSLSRDHLWPPNHQLVPITARLSLDDACDREPRLRLKSITSNEPDDGCGDGDTMNDVQGADFGTADLEFSVRAERSGTGTGRTYTVIYEAIDAAGNVAEVTGLITVAHDSGP